VTRYDAAWSAVAGVDAAKTAAVAADATALATWSSAYTAATIDADHAARHAESLEVTARAGLPAPYVVTVGGTSIVLAPSSAILVAIDALPIATAARSLLVGASPALRVVARDSGTAGNRVEVKVENATSGSTKCKLSVRLGSYTETYDEIAGGDAIDVGASMLFASASWFGTTRPDNLTWSALTGGTGGSLAAVTARIDRALQLPAAAAQAKVLGEYRAALVASHGARPRAVTYGTDPYRKKLFDGHRTSVLDIEGELTPLVDEAARLLAAETY
jgi:hypothetical protein